MHHSGTSKLDKRWFVKERKVLLTFPQAGQAYRACWVISIFFTLQSHKLKSQTSEWWSSRLPQGGTISCPVLSSHSDLLCSFGLKVGQRFDYQVRRDQKIYPESRSLLARQDSLEPPDLPTKHHGIPGRMKIRRGMLLH